VNGEEEICFEDESGRVTPIDIKQTLESTRRYAGLIQFLRDYDNHQFTLSLEQYLYMPATLSTAMQIWRHEKGMAQRER